MFKFLTSPEGVSFRPVCDGVAVPKPPEEYPQTYDVVGVMVARYGGEVARSIQVAFCTPLSI